MSSDATAKRGRRPSKVEPAEYTDPAGETAKVETTEETSTDTPSEEPTESKAPEAKKVAKNDAWEVGKPAPYTVYWDHMATKYTRVRPVRSRGLVVEGDVVTQRVADIVKEGEV